MEILKGWGRWEFVAWDKEVFQENLQPARGGGSLNLLSPPFTPSNFGCVMKTVLDIVSLR